MKRVTVLLASTIACLTLALGLSASAVAAPSEWRVGGGGILNNGDHFSGTAADSSGQWNHHVVQTGDRLRGTVESTDCTVAGTETNCTVFGTGTFNAEPVIFVLLLSDSGEAGAADGYTLFVVRQSDNALIHVFSGTTDKGNLHVHGGT